MSMKSIPNTGTKYGVNSEHEVARRIRQMNAGKLKAANGLYVAPVVVSIVEVLAPAVPKKAPRKRAASKLQVLDQVAT